MCNGTDWKTAGLLDYCWFHYTLLDQLWPLSISLLLVWLGFLFYLMASITSGFLVPGVNKLSQILTVSNKLAGVAFLACCNGLPHVIAAGVAIVFSSPHMGIGSMIGSGLINTTLIWAFVLMSAPFLSVRELGIYRRPFYRDLSFVLLALLGVFVVLLNSTVRWWMPVVFLTCYLLYLLVVFVGRYIYQRFSKQQREALGMLEDAEELQDLAVLDEPDEYPNLDELMFIRRTRRTAASPAPSSSSSSSLSTPAASYSLLDDGLDDDGENDNERDHLADRNDDRIYPPAPPSSSSSDEYSDDYNDDDDIAVGRSSNNSTRRTHVRRPSTSSASSSSLLSSLSSSSRQAKSDGLWDRLTHYLSVATHWPERSVPQRIWFVISLPVILIRNATIPIVGEEDWIFAWALINPIAAPLVVLLATHYFATASIAGVFPVWALLLCLGVVVAVVVYFTSTAVRPPPYYWVFVVGCVFMCLVWMYLVSCEILDLLRLLGEVFAVSDAGLGLTILAWGISAGDVFTQITLTNQGFRNMALSAALGSPTFTILIGVGLSLLIKVASEGGTYTIDLVPLLDLGFGSFALVLVVLGIAMPIMSFKPTQIFAWFLVVIYVLFLICVVLFELHVLP